jgi:type I restriction enzyme, R subunit
MVHFAVSNREAHLTTRLDGTNSVFLPFNQGDNGGAGNPANPNGGHRTAYLWEQVWERQNWLEILGRYLVAPKDKKKQIGPNSYSAISFRAPSIRRSHWKAGPGSTLLSWTW